MPLDISKPHTKTEINLSKPYHKGPLLVDLKSKNYKSLIDIKPVRKVAIQGNNTEQTESIEYSKSAIESQEAEQKVFVTEVKAPTLDFEKLEKFDDTLNPFSQAGVDNFVRNASDIQISSESKSKITEDINTKTNIKQLGDVKKVDEFTSSISFFSSLKPKINVAPLHNRSRMLAAIDQNRALAKRIRAKRNQVKSQPPIDNHKIDLENFKTTTLPIDFGDVAAQDFFQFKAPPKFNASDIPQFSDHFSFQSIQEEASRVNLHELNNELHNSNLRKKIRNSNKFKRYSVSTLLTTVVIIFCTLFLTGNTQWMGKFGEKNVQADKNKSTKTVSYDKWIIDNNLGKYSPPGDDLDKDGLSNYEEFLIGSIPTNKNSCNINATDNQNLLDLVDPVSCMPIDFQAFGQLQRFKDVLNTTPEFIQKYQAKNLQVQSYQPPTVQIINSTISVSQSSAAALTDILPIPKAENSGLQNSFKEVSAEIKAPFVTTQNPIVDSPVLENKKTEAVKTEIANSKPGINSNAVQQYIDQYRSYDKYDNQVASPVSADYFIDMSQRYGVPLKYTLALARSESRFGTDQFNQDGSGNRIGRHLNMYSIGLDDTGGSVDYPSWEAGVDAFGRWYTKFENQGYGDCAKWRIYNPNGDYCQKIENLASEISSYIGG
jgi:hypothetical protein